MRHPFIFEITAVVIEEQEQGHQGQTHYKININLTLELPFPKILHLHTFGKSELDCIDYGAN